MRVARSFRLRLSSGTPILVRQICGASRAAADAPSDLSFPAEFLRGAAAYPRETAHALLRATHNTTGRANRLPAGRRDACAAQPDREVPGRVRRPLGRGPGH